ncbi:MAG TPA: hypothetical protein VFX02_08760 [Gammaproteobacteria bacterium]|nr:hypothetical protein [Gammaproteobacteria bacterium]
MNYITVYDALQEAPDYESILMFAFWVPVSVVVAIQLVRSAKKRQWAASIFLSIWLVVFTGFGGLGFANTFWKQAECERWLAAGDYIISEGIVEDFDPMPSGGHKDESFKLGPYKFSYSDFDLTRGCFNNARSHGGPIYENRAVRLFHKNGVILRIDVKK